MADSTPRLTMPTIPSTDPRFKWTAHGDVQAVWRRFGWTPPSEGRTQFYDDEPVKQPARLRRAK